MSEPTTFEYLVQVVVSENCLGAVRNNSEIIGGIKRGISTLGSDIESLGISLKDNYSHRPEDRAAAVENRKTAAISDLIDQWDEAAGIDSKARTAFGPQSVSVELVVNKIREILDQ